MKTAKILISLFLLLVIALFTFMFVAGVRDSAHENNFMARPDDNETYPHKLARYRSGAEVAARTECTNEVVGLRQIINLQTDTSDNNFMQWTTIATVEFINKVGGVERTTLVLKPYVGSGKMSWITK